MAVQSKVSGAWEVRPKGAVLGKSDVALLLHFPLCRYEVLAASGLRRRSLEKQGGKKAPWNSGQAFSSLEPQAGPQEHTGQ